MTTTIGEAERAAWARDGHLHVGGVLVGWQLDEVCGWVDDIAARADGEHELLQHYELTGRGAQIARSENLVPSHAGFRALITQGAIPAMAATLLGEPAVLYKEKINYKLVGGAGFAPHQDARAYKFIDVHLTGMVAIDDATVENGCLEVATGRHAALLADDDDGCIDGDVAAGLEWTTMPVAAGDVLWFHSRLPHRSGPNRSPTTRRALFCTYNAAAEGDLRASYYADKRRYFADRGADTARVSTIGDFLGVAPTSAQIHAMDRHG